VQLWAETYTRDLSSADVFAIQDDVTDRVVATVADVHGMLMGSMQQSIRDVPIDQLSAYELMLRGWAYHRQPTREEHARLRDALEAMSARQPHDPDVWAALGNLYGHEYSHWFNPRPDSLLRARQAARQAVEIDPVGQLGWEALAVIFFFERDVEGFHMAVDRAIALNPRNTNTLGWMALLLGHHGEADRSHELVTRAMRLNPHHPGWYHFVLFDWHYLRGEFAESLAAARRVNTPDFVWMHIVIANACGRLGRAVEARTALREMRALEPAFVHDAAVEEATRRWFWDPGLAEQMMIGFRAARAFEAKTT
jgi:tetratricopeptide (TPR) repeat protein